MGRIFRRVNVSGSKNQPKRLRAIFDTGSEDNCIVPEFFEGGSVEDLGIIEYGKEEIKTLANGYPIKCRKIKLKSLEVEGILINEPEFYIISLPGAEVLIGAKTMQELKMILNPSIHNISFSD